MKSQTLKAKWRKDIDKDFVRESQMDEMRLNKKEGKDGTPRSNSNLCQVP